MATVMNPISEISRTAMEAAAKATRISMDSAERTINIQLEYARGALEQATLNARTASQVKDLQQLLALPSRIAENALENALGYSRSLYEVASIAQTRFSGLAEERLAAFQQAVAESVDQAAKAAPAGGDVAVAAIKSQLAATTAAFDTFSKAARNLTSLADAGVPPAARPARSRK